MQKSTGHNLYIHLFNLCAEKGSSETIQFLFFDSASQVY